MKAVLTLLLNGQNYIINKKYEQRQMKKKLQKKLEELKKRDPFVYKSF